MPACSKGPSYVAMRRISTAVAHVLKLLSHELSQIVPHTFTHIDILRLLCSGWSRRTNLWPVRQQEFVSWHTHSAAQATFFFFLRCLVTDQSCRVFFE